MGSVQKQVVRPGIVLGQWKLGKRLKVGGQGEVWEVRPLESSHSPPRAMKLCTDSVEQGRERFKREVQLLSGMAHPNVVPILDSNLDWKRHEKVEIELSYSIDSVNQSTERPSFSKVRSFSFFGRAHRTARRRI